MRYVIDPLAGVGGWEGGEDVRLGFLWSPAEDREPLSISSLPGGPLGGATNFFYLICESTKQ